ncbi:MAG: hypothetical protein WC878_08295 [Candidatus Paceibacterota bacterium]
MSEKLLAAVQKRAMARSPMGGPLDGKKLVWWDGYDCMWSDHGNCSGTEPKWKE